MEIDQDNLEKALSNISTEETPTQEANQDSCACNSNDGCCGGNHDCGDDCKCAKEEELGFHKGALNTLAAERNELIKMIQNVESIMQAHLKRLEEMGVKIQTQEQNSNQ